MYTCKIIAAVGIIATMSIQSAAFDKLEALKSAIISGSESPEAIISSMIGFACNSRGTHALLKSYKEDPSPNCSITLAYSEHPDLKKHGAAKLQQIAEKIDVLKKKYDAQHLYIFTKELLKAHASTTATDHIDQSSQEFDDTLIVLCIQLDEENMISRGCKLQPVNFFDNHENIWAHQNNNFLYQSVEAIGHFAYVSRTSIADPQAVAELRQSKKSKNSFHLLINLDEWRQFISAYRLIQKDNPAPKLSSKKRLCMLQ